ncbi:MAG: protein translocase subunit SecD [Eubacteriaceae bacterium]|nr:protein translocase subunit SecD [Eubacteriaceae bacterium]
MVVLAITALVTFLGLPLSKVVGYYDIEPITSSIHYGLDLTGGVYVVLEAAEEDMATGDAVERSITIIRERIDSLGVKEPTITKQGSNRIRISIPDIANQEEALDIIGRTAQLTFLAPDRSVILTGKDVVDAKGVYQQTSAGVNQPVVSLSFSPEGTKLFAEATQKYYGKIIAINLDGKDISTPKVNAVITNGQAVIEGMASLEEASKIAMLIKGGALPVTLTPVEIRTIGPTLGQNAFSSSMFAAGIGIILIFIFMIVLYKVPGFVSCLGLIIYTLITLFILAAMKVTLTLPGIAGIILSIGMAVDANVIIFERIREEIMLGKSILLSIKIGFQRAMTTILDSNITTMIAGMVLFVVGTGTVKGFALTLMIGIVVSMFTAVLVTRQLLKLVYSTGVLATPKYYGAKETKA